MAACRPKQPLRKSDNSLRHLELEIRQDARADVYAGSTSLWSDDQFLANPFPVGKTLKSEAAPAALIR